MVLRVIRLFKSLTRYHYIAIFITILLPVIGPECIADIGREYQLKQEMLDVVALFIWSIWVVLAVALMVRRDRSEAKQMVEPQIAALSGRISSLEKQHLEKQYKDLRVELLREVDNLEESVKETLRESLGVVLPPRPISLSLRATAGSPTASFNLTGAGGSKVARLREWLRRKARGIWEVVYGKPEGS